MPNSPIPAIIIYTILDFGVLFLIKQVIFDFDGTLADSENVFFHVTNDVCRRFNLPLFDTERYAYFSSIPIKQAIKELGVKWYQVPRYSLEGCLSFMRRISSISLFDGVIDLLDELEQIGLGLSIISSNSHENIRHLLRKNNVRCFDNIISVQKLFKKHRFIKNFLKRHDLESHEVLYVGDEVRDIHACKKANIKIIAASWGFDDLNHLKEENPDYIVNHPSEIVEIINDYDQLQNA